MARNKRNRRKVRRQKSAKRNFYVSLGVVVALVIVAAAYLILDQPPEVDVARLEEMIENDYAEQVNFVFVNFPVISINDPISAEAAQCALDEGQDAFWTFHNSII
jgi:hypothetical protein